jgi:hypothetical protein
MVNGMKILPKPITDITLSVGKYINIYKKQKNKKNKKTKKQKTRKQKKSFFL